MSFNVSFISSGFSIPDQVVAENGYAVRPTDPVVSGQLLAYWYTDPNFSEITRWDFETDQVTANVTLYARWVDESTMTYYAFGGWFRNVELTIPWDFVNNVVTADTTLWGKWISDPNIVRFNSNGGTVIPIISVADGATVPEPNPAPIKTGYTFDGWYEDEALTIPFVFGLEPEYNDITIYAGWELNVYTVEFESSGSAVTSQQISHGSPVVEPTAPTKLGYTFDGWYEDAGYTNPWVFNSEVVVTDITLYGKFIINTYTVSFNSNGGTAVSSQQIDHFDLVTEPTSPTLYGHTFAGWYHEAGFTTPWNFSTDTISGNTTLYAKWTVNVYTVTFITNGDTGIAPIQVPFNSTISEPPAPTKKRFAFLDND